MVTFVFSENQTGVETEQSSFKKIVLKDSYGDRKDTSSITSQSGLGGERLLLLLLLLISAETFTNNSPGSECCKKQVETGAV